LRAAETRTPGGLQWSNGKVSNPQLEAVSNWLYGSWRSEGNGTSLPYKTRDNTIFVTKREILR